MPPKKNSQKVTLVGVELLPLELEYVDRLRFARGRCSRASIIRWAVLMQIRQDGKKL